MEAMDFSAQDFSELQYEASREMMAVAAECTRYTRRQRPELVWLKAKYEEKRKEYRLKRSEMDALIYNRMYDREPETPAALLKVRYWRTGQHMPLNRETCLLFCRALELDAVGTSYMLTAYMDTGRDCYEHSANTDECYRMRRLRLQELTRAYVRRSAPEVADSRSRLRHLYFLDALRYHVSLTGCSDWKKPVNSINYDTEFQRNLLLIGEIPRRTMLRHLIILMLPDLSLDRLQDALIQFGYLPLSPHHTLRSGEPLDKLLLSMIPLYERINAAEGTEAASRWFLLCYRHMDAYFVEHGAHALRFLYFKALNQ